MSADVSAPYGQVPATRHTGLRVAVGVLGAAAVVVGVALLFHPVAAARTLALLVGLALILGGLLEMAAGWDSDRRWPAFALGAVLVIGGILAAAWPRVTLGTVAVIVGLSLIVHGVARIVTAVSARKVIPGWGWLALAGAVNLLIGILALVWPHATVLVLCLVLGVQVLVFGLILLAAAFWRPAAVAV
jgi:uncharacterized membrane protein HdeD (DUF308 family)